MKSTHLSKWIVVGAVTAVMLAAALPGEAQRRASAQVGPNCVGGVGALVDEIEPAPLTDADTADVLYLREEEKLARDVYLTLAERWQLPIFANIARAEQQHMDLVLLMIQTYGLEDPVVDDAVGAFTDVSLGSLFNELTAAGQISLIEALFVGATIEDMDLADLLEITANTQNRHLALVAYNLAKGSRNHLRAFVKALAAQGETYTPQYLDQDTFDAVLAAETERQVWYDADGNPVPACGAAVGGFGMRRGPGQGGQGNGEGTGECGGTGDCGAGPNGGHQGNGSGSGNGSGNGNGNGSGNGNGDGDGDCDGTGPHGSGGS